MKPFTYQILTGIAGQTILWLLYANAGGGPGSDESLEGIYLGCLWAVIFHTGILYIGNDRILNHLLNVAQETEKTAVPRGDGRTE